VSESEKLTRTVGLLVSRNTPITDRDVVDLSDRRKKSVEVSSHSFQRLVDWDNRKASQKKRSDYASEER
jgi:hypothetical protein